MRIRPLALFVSVVVVWVSVTTAMAPDPAPVQDPTAVTVVAPTEDTSDTSCWVEKVTSQDTAEAVCGARGLRPAGSVDLGAELTIDGHQWVATLGGLEPVGAN